MVGGERARSKGGRRFERGVRGRGPDADEHETVVERVNKKSISPSILLIVLSNLVP